MRLVSDYYKDKIRSGETRNFLIKIDLTLADDTTLTLTEHDIIADSFKILTASSGDSTFDIGSAIIGKCEFSLINFDDRYLQYDFFNATAVVWVKLEGDSEYHRIGFYTVDEPNYVGSIIQIEMLDNMWLFDVPLADVNLSFPATILTAVTTICTHCGVTLADTSFNGYNFTISELPDKEMNCREFLQYVAMIGCNFCIMNSQGQLKIRWYNTPSIEEDSLDGGSFLTNTTPYSDGDTADGGNFTNYSSGDDYDGGSFVGEDIPYFTRLFTRNLVTDEITITGVKFIIDETEYSIGTEGYVLILENPLVNVSNVNAILNLIWGVLGNFKMRGFSVTALPDIAPEVGDYVAISYKGNMIYSYLTSFTFTPSSCSAALGCEAPTRNLQRRYSKSVQTAVEIAKTKTNEIISVYDNAVQMMNAIAVNAMGAYEAYEEAPTGGRIYYLSNRPITFDDQGIKFVVGSTVFKITGDGFFVAQSAGARPSSTTFVNGYNTQTGQLVINVLDTIGINADWIKSGTIATNLITALDSTTTVGGKTIDAIAQEKADAAELAAENAAAQALAAQVAIYDADIADLQNQIDGNVTTWYYSGTPTLNNLPASEWTTTTDKDNHIGDIYYDSVTGYAYRFMKDGNNYVWIKISDSDIEAALAEAQDAWDLADNKRRIFVTTPVPPYDVGDLWVQGDGGDIKRCAVAKTDTQTYAAEDWVLASKYTDDTALVTWINNTYSADKIDIKAQIDQRAETFYQPNDPSIEWGSTINFNSQCRTESIEWDWIDIYYRKSNGTYEYVRRGGKFEGPINIPSTEFWIYWHTDNSQHNYYGWKVDSVVQYAGTSYTTPTGSANALPSYGTMDLPIEQLESTHPYTDGINIVYHSYLVNHEGDLWYRTTDNTTWYYNGYTWEQQDIPTAVFDKIDGKAQIFTTQPTPPYNVGDLWCEGASGDILTCITAKSSDQSYSASDWSKRNKYTDDTTVNTLDNNLNQSGLMYRLTNGTKSEGIYLENGHIYINISRAEIGTMSADRIYGGALMLGGLNDTRGQLIAMGVPEVETSYSLYSGQTGSWYSEPLIDGMLWINVTSTSAPTGTSCGRARLNNGEWIDLYSGSNFIGYYTSITLEYNASYNYSAQIVTAGALARIDNGGIIAEQINAKGGYIGDLTLADGELYVRGEYNLNNQNVSVTKSAKNIKLKAFKPYKMYIKESSFKLVLDYTISVSVSRTIQLQTQRYDYSSGVWTTIDTQTLNNAAGSYTVEVNRTFYNDETDSYRIRIAINKVTSTSNFNLSTHLYINNVTKVSVSSDGIWGNFYGMLNGSADLDNANIGDINLEGTTVSGNDSNSDAYFTLNDQLLTMYDTDGNYAFFDHNGIDCEDGANSEATITINHDYIYVSSSNTRYARCSYSGLNLHVDSNNYCIFNRNAITAVYEGSSYYVDWQQGSDARIKEEIEPLNIELSKNLINATETKKFRYKSGGGKHYGMIAQEARKLLDDLGEAEAELEYGPKVHNDDIPNYRAIRYDEYIPHLINYVKDLRAELNRVKAELNELKEGK